MSKKTIFTGSATAIVTPFNKDGVDFQELEKLIEFQISNNIDSILACGTTGESSTMPDHEHLSVVKFIIEKVNKRVPVIANTGSNDTAHAIRLSIAAEKLGADALLSVSPYYNKTTQAGLVAHFKAIASSVRIPILLYNVPSRTVINIDAPTVIELSKVSNIVGIKECNLSQAAEIIKYAEEGFSVYSGDDENILCYLSLGAKGLISVMGNIIPNEAHDLVTSFLNNDIVKSQKIFYDTFNLSKALFIETNPMPVKRALEHMGMIAGDVRLPLIKMSDKGSKILESEMKKYGLI